MKKKKIKSLAKQIFNLGREYDRKRYEDTELKEVGTVSTSLSSDHNYCEYDESASQKFSKFILSLIKIKDKISIDLDGTSPCSFSVLCDLNKLKNNKNNQNNYKENTFDARIDKVGFKIRRNYSNWISYKDPNIFDSLKEQFVEKNKIISKELLFETVDDLTIELNLSRENNLEEILS
jgi:hypothetical protein